MFRLKIDTDNDAFGPTTRHEAREVAAALRIVAIALEQAWREGMREGTVRDYNGNTVGQWTLDGAPDASAEMLEALQKVARIMRFGQRVTVGELAKMADELRQNNKSIKAAIAKAEGRTP